MGSDIGKGCSKQALLAALPRLAGDLGIRALTRDDLDSLARWPGYPAEYKAFKLRFAGMSPAQRGELFLTRQADIMRITLVADHTDQPCIGYLGLVGIEWSKRTIGNMGFRIHPAWCNRGIGTQFMRAAAGWAFEQGIEVLRLDVAGANPRAIRCYEKAGFTRTGEFWQQEPKLRDVDLDEPRYESLRSHIRSEGGMPYVRFYWMEWRAQGRGAGLGVVVPGSG